MKFGIVVFPGSNCDRDMEFALRNDLKQEVVMLWHKDEIFLCLAKMIVLYYREVFHMAIICVVAPWLDLVR